MYLWIFGLSFRLVNIIKAIMFSITLVDMLTVSIMFVIVEWKIL